MSHKSKAGIPNFLKVKKAELGNAYFALMTHFANFVFFIESFFL